ncbi:MAG: hypothetical protein ACTSVG_04380 [Alphaproteobacteria bacterium]
MRAARILAISVVAAGLTIAPAYGGSEDSGAGTEDRPLSEQLDDVLRDLMEQMKPALDELLETLEVLEGVDSIKHYQSPEILPNGDIIIRRREDAPPLPHPLPRDDGKDQGEKPGVRT